jgi:hypothetical protein
MILSKESISLVIAILISIIVVMILGRNKTNFNDLALGDETAPYYAINKNGKVHFTDLEELKEFNFNQNLDKELILCLGNSQTHSINQIQKGEVNYVQLLADTLEDKTRILAVSLPNASLQEFMVIFDYVTNLTSINYLIVPIFMDDLREEGLRVNVFFKNLIAEKYQIRDTSSAIAKKLNIELASYFEVKEVASDMAALSETPQEKVETYLNNKLENYSQTWKDRPQIRGDFFYSLYLARNYVFRINAQTKRKMIPVRYENNLAALKYILKKCEEKNIKSIIYIPPLRNDVEPPYNIEEYTNFKMNLQSEVDLFEKARFNNFENLVDGKFWGTKASTTIGGEPELDFMHFQYEGHKMLFDSLISELNKVLKI